MALKENLLDTAEVLAMFVLWVWIGSIALIIAIAPVWLVLWVMLKVAGVDCV